MLVVTLTVNAGRASADPSPRSVATSTSAPPASTSSPPRPAIAAIDPAPASATTAAAPAASLDAATSSPPAALQPDYAAKAVELNVAFAFVGIFDMRLIVPFVRAHQRDFRGELMLGAYSDYSWGPLSRPADDYGKVLLLAAKVGYRQHFTHGLTADVSAYLGWRHEEDNVYDGGTLDAFIGRLWIFAGWQRDLGPRFYLGLRGGLGTHLFRTDRWSEKERTFVPAGDLSLGVRF